MENLIRTSKSLFSGLLLRLLFFALVLLAFSETHEQIDLEQEILFSPIYEKQEIHNNSDENHHFMHNTRNKIVDCVFECEKKCNYQPFIEGACFGLFQMNCEVAQQYETGQVLQTRTSLSCLGNFNNITESIEDFIRISTICDGMLSQVQIINLYDPMYSVETASSDTEYEYVKADTYFTSYSCRHRFTFIKKIKLDADGQPNLSAGNEETLCDVTQAVQIQKGYCMANNYKCTSMEKETTKFVFRSSVNEVNKDNKEELNLGFNDGKIHPRIDQVFNFQKLAKRDPILAQKIANSILKTVSESGMESNRRDEALLTLLTKCSNGIETTMSSMSSFSSYPSTRWLSILCNGQVSSFFSPCNGLLTAQVLLYPQGSGYILCKGGWYAFEDVTYMCDGSLTEDETLYANNNYRLSKISQCLGRVAISPCSTEVLQGTKYYGISEICNGNTVATSSYEMDDIDHRIFARIVNPRSAQQIICLMEDRTCKHLS
eukprot:g2254.t1